VAGDPEAYGELVRQHQGYAYRLCLTILADHHDAEEAASAAFYKAYRALPRFQGQSRFRTWLTRIAVNQCKDRLRQRRRQAARSLDGMLEAGAPLPSALVAPAPAPPAPALPLEALEQLSPGERSLLELLRDEDGLSYEELGRRLGLSLDAVKGRLKRAREKLRHFLRPPGVE
jgi:RNA polymerase sigma-70 factor (ECF subfamily)